VILSHSVIDFGLVIWVDFFQAISDLGRHWHCVHVSNFLLMQIFVCCHCVCSVIVIFGRMSAFHWRRGHSSRLCGWYIFILSSSLFTGFTQWGNTHYEYKFTFVVFNLSSILETVCSWLSFMGINSLWFVVRIPNVGFLVLAQYFTQLDNNCYFKLL